MPTTQPLPPKNEPATDNPGEYCDQYKAGRRCGWCIANIFSGCEQQRMLLNDWLWDDDGNPIRKSK